MWKQRQAEHAGVLISRTINYKAQHCFVRLLSAPYIIGLCLCLLSTATLLGQERSAFGQWIRGDVYDGEMPLRTSHTKLLFGIGATGVEDAYLSEITHSGLKFSILAQTDYPLKDCGSKWHLYQEAGVWGGLPANPANGSVMYQIGGRYSLGAAWRALMWKGFSVDLAPMLTAFVQGHLKLTNINNVTSIKASFGLDAWGRVRYRLPIASFPLSVQYSLRMPLIHAAFAPNYGQSYYEFVASDPEKLDIKFQPVSFGNHFGVEQHLLIDLPIRHFTLTIGAGHRYHSELLNDLRYREGTWMGLLGVSFDLFSLSGGRALGSGSVHNALD